MVAYRHSLVTWMSRGCTPCAQGGDINLDIRKVVAYRHWCNKLWNAIKFALRNLGDDFAPSPSHAAAGMALMPCRSLIAHMNGQSRRSRRQAMLTALICGCAWLTAQPGRQSDIL